MRVLYMKLFYILSRKSLKSHTCHALWQPFPCHAKPENIASPSLTSSENAFTDSMKAFGYMESYNLFKDVFSAVKPRDRRKWRAGPYHTKTPVGQPLKLRIRRQNCYCTLWIVLNLIFHQEGPLILPHRPLAQCEKGWKVHVIWPPMAEGFDVSGHAYDIF
jgi:hypothetical protein